MLFLPKAICDARLALGRDFEAGRISLPVLYRKMLDLDPDDHVGRIGLGQLRMNEGDIDGAKALLWHAVQSHPCVSTPYLALAQLFVDEPESMLPEALAELGLSRARDDEGEVGGSLDALITAITGDFLEAHGKLTPAEKRKLFILILRRRRDLEPPATAELLRPLRLLQKMLDDADLDKETVDAILAAGRQNAALMMPLLVGVLRDWGQNLIRPDADGEDLSAAAVENSLALLGEIGSPSGIPVLLEFVDLQNQDAAGAATWALGRVVQRHPVESAQCIGSLIPSLGPAERLAVSDQILRCPELDRGTNLLQRLSESLEGMSVEDRDEFFPMLLGSMAAARGREGVSLGRAALRESGSQLSRHVRRECESLLDDFIRDGVSPVDLGPFPETVYEICAGEVVWRIDDEDDEADEDDFPESEPILKKVIPGRNEPCWCDSGKKYKKCHLDSDAEQNRSALPNRDGSGSIRGNNEFTALRKRIGEFLGQVLSQRELKQALDEFVGERKFANEDVEISVTDWILHDRVSPSLGRTLMEHFLFRNRSRLTAREREMVEAWSRSFVGLYEVQELRAGIGLTLKDLIFDGTFFVHDVSLSTRLARWDAVLARVVPGERGTELAGAGVTVPRQQLAALRDWLDSDRADRALEWREYLKGNWPRIRLQSFEIAANWVESLQLVNTDGEELLLSRATYTVSDVEAVAAALRNCPGFSEEDVCRFVWLNEKKTVLGNIRLEGNRLTLECNSRQRLERGRQLIDRLAGQSLTHLRDDFTTQKGIRRRAAEGGPPDIPEIPKAERDEVVTRYLEHHYREWPDTKLPALNGETPREAARTSRGRTRLNRILKDIENGEDRKRQTGDPFYDVNRLRTELGLN